MQKLGFAACAIVPGAVLAAAHWFPWRRAIGRDLPRLAAYAIGTAAIVGTAATVIAHDDGDGSDHAALLITAAAGAGLVTLAAWALDYVVSLRADLAARRRYEEVIAGGQRQI